jgi:hypothetical protein
MTKTGPPYPPEFCRQMVEMVRASACRRNCRRSLNRRRTRWVGRAECDAAHVATAATTAFLPECSSKCSRISLSDAALETAQWTCDRKRRRVSDPDQPL